MSPAQLAQRMDARVSYVLVCTRSAPNPRRRVGQLRTAQRTDDGPLHWYCRGPFSCRAYRPMRHAIGDPCSRCAATPRAVGQLQTAIGSGRARLEAGSRGDRCGDSPSPGDHPLRQGPPPTADANSLCGTAASGPRPEYLLRKINWVSRCAGVSSIRERSQIGAGKGAHWQFLRRGVLPIRPRALLCVVQVRQLPVDLLVKHHRQRRRVARQLPECWIGCAAACCQRIAPRRSGDGCGKRSVDAARTGPITTSDAERLDRISTADRVRTGPGRGRCL